MKKTIKLIGIISILLILVLVLTGCKEKETIINDNKTNKTEETKTIVDEELVRGKWENNVYINEFAKLKFKLPEKWQYSSDEEIAQLMNISVDLLENDLQGLTKIAEQTGVYDMVSNNPDTGASVMIMFEKPVLKVSSDYYLNKIKEQLGKVTTFNYKISDEIETATIAGKEYSVVTAKVEEYNMVQKYYIKQEGSYFIDILVTYLEGKDNVNDILSHFE